MNVHENIKNNLINTPNFNIDITTAYLIELCHEIQTTHNNLTTTYTENRKNLLEKLQEQNLKTFNHLYNNYDQEIKEYASKENIANIYELISDEIKLYTIEEQQNLIASKTIMEEFSLIAE